MTSPTTPAEHDPFFQLLTEALRAGPGSAQWGEAVAKLRDGGLEGGDEYKLILRAREDIGLGRDFRKVSAGPGFTRKILDAVEREGARGSGVPTATIVAILSGIVILAVIVTVIVIMSRGGGAKDPQQAAIERLERATAPISVASVTFNGQTQWPPDGFRVVEGVTLDATKELKVSGPAPAAATTQASKFSSGGLISSTSLSAVIPAAIEAEVVLPPAGTGQPLTQLFVSDSTELKPDPASPVREIAWTYRDGRASIDVQGRAPESVALGAPGDTLKVSIRFDRDTAIVEAGGRRLYAGPHGLDPDKPRYAGLRFLQADGDTGESVRVRSISLAQSAPVRMQE